jgi:cyclic pyranopterin phosphate synthase
MDAPISGDPPSSLYIRLSLTEGCNLRCRYCRPAEASSSRPGQDESLSDAELLSLVARVNEAIPIRKIRFTGGEPLLKPGVERLIAAYRQLLPRAKLCLTTNGTRLKNRAAALKQAGIKYLNISLDTLTEQAFQEVARKPGLKDVMAGIAAARHAGFERLKLNTVLLRTRNKDQVEELVRLAARFGCEIRFVELMPFGQGAHLFEQEFFSAGEALERLQNRLPLIRTEQPSDTAKRYRFDVDGREVVVGFITPVSHPFCSSCDRIRLDSFGRMFFCLRSEEGIDLAKPLRKSDTIALVTRIRRMVAQGERPRLNWPRRSMVHLGG